MFGLIIEHFYETYKFEVLSETLRTEKTVTVTPRIFSFFLEIISLSES